MSNTVNLTDWDGGHADDLRTTEGNQSESSLNFDITTNPHKMIPYSDPVAETVSTGSAVTTDFTITDVAILPVSGVSTAYAMGRKSLASPFPAIFKKNSTSDITAAWAQVADAAGSTLTPNTLIEYYDKTAALNNLYFQAGGYLFYKFVAPSTITLVASMLSSYTLNFAPRPFRHPIDDTLYLASGNLVYKFDAVTYTVPTLVHTLAAYFEIQSFTDYGNYLAVGGKYLSRHKRSAVYLSNRVIPNDGAQMVIDWGEGSLQILENIGGSLVGISYTETVGSYTTQNSYKIFIKVYSGGAVETIKEIATGSTATLRAWKSKSGDKLYFGYDTDNAMYVVGKNKKGRWYIAKNRYYNPTGSYLAGASGLLSGLSSVGDITFTSYGDATTDGYLARQGTGSAYTLTSTYSTTINPKMIVAHRVAKKRLLSVRVKYTVGTAGGTVGVLLKKDGASNFASIISQSQSSVGEYVTKSYKFADATEFDDAYEFQFQMTSVGNVSIEQLDYEYDILND